MWTINSLQLTTILWKNMIFYGSEFRIGDHSDYVSVRCANQFIRKHLLFYSLQYFRPLRRSFPAGSFDIVWGLHHAELTIQLWKCSFNMKLIIVIRTFSVGYVNTVNFLAMQRRPIHLWSNLRIAYRLILLWSLVPTGKTRMRLFTNKRDKILK